MIKHQLTNGIRVVLKHIPSFRSVSFGIWVKAGSRHERPEQNGISHFIEHMLFKGTERFTAAQIAELFDGIGGNVNAFTTKEYTCYYAKVLDEHLPLAVDVLSDMFFRSRFAAEELEKERNVILEEIAMYEDTPDDLVHDLLATAAYGNHPLGQTILGTKQNLQAFSADDLRAYMQQHYIVPNIVLSVAGNVDEGIIPLLEQAFGSFTRTGEPAGLTPPVFRSEAVFRQKQTEQNHVCLTWPGFSNQDPSLYAMILLSNIIGGGMSSRLFQEIRENRGLAYSIYAFHNAYMDNGMLTVYAGTAPNQTKEVLDLTLHIVEDVLVNGISDAELKRGKEQLKGSLILSMESTTSQMNRMGKNELLLGRHYSLNDMIAMIEAVDPEQIRSVAKQVFTQPYALAMVGHSDKPLRKLGRDYLVL